MPKFQYFPLREIRPAGWLEDFLQRQASGLTGNVAVSGYPYGYKFWGTKADNTKGSYSQWWSYEQTAYWIDGALKCGFFTDDDELYQEALEEIDFAVENAAEDGFIGPDFLRKKDRWPYAVFFRAVLAQYEVTGDRRYINALVRHYRSTPHPMDWDRDVSGVEIMLLLYHETGESDLLEKAEALYAEFNRKFPEHDASLQSMRSDKKLSEHGVTFNELAKLAAMLYTATGQNEYLDAVVHAYEKLGAQARLADGQHSCSEHIKGNTTRDMHETCDLTDHTWALYYLLQATNDVHYADTIENVVYNALPGAITKDFRALQYFSCPNQVVVTNSSNHNIFMRGLNWMSFRPDHEVQCCPGNVHRTMPNFISRIWMHSTDGGVIAVLYGPGKLQTKLGTNQTPVTISAQTRYPYEQLVAFSIDPEQPVSFPFSLRIPGWAKNTSLRINSQKVDAKLQPGTFFTIEREWQNGDKLELELPFSLALEHWQDGGISLTYGPLTLAYPVPTRAEIERENSTIRQRKETLREQYEERPIVVKEDFPAWNLYPDGEWNYALHIDEGSLQNLQVEWNEDCTDPLDAENPALKLRVKASRVRHWHIVHKSKIRQRGHWIENGEFKSGLLTIEGDFHFTPPLPDPQKLPKRLGNVEEIELIPYAATILRVTVFPQVKE